MEDFPRIHHSGNPQQMMTELQCEPENFTGRIIFMSMFNDIVWDAKGSDELCVNNSKTNKEYAESFLRGRRSFLGPGSDKKWYGTYDGKPDGSWNRTAEKMLQNFKDSGHPVFRCTSPLERGQLRSKGGGKTTIHFNGRTENIELLFQMVISVSLGDWVLDIWVLPLVAFGMDVEHHSRNALCHMILDMPASETPTGTNGHTKHCLKFCANIVRRGAAYSLRHHRARAV